MTTTLVDTGMEDGDSNFWRRMGKMKEVPTSDLLERLKGVMAATAEMLIEAAAIVRVLEDRGEDLEDVIKPRRLNLLRRIGQGSLMPEIVISNMSEPALVNKFARLTVDDQKKLVADEPVAVLVLNALGESDKRMVRPSELTKEEHQQIFDYDHIRTLAEQRTWLRQQEQTAATREPKDGRFDVYRGKLRVKVAMVFTKEELLKILEKM
jgi:hypothetical protein